MTGGLLVVGSSAQSSKSLVATGLCRALRAQGAVAPFKAITQSSGPDDMGTIAPLCRAAGVPLAPVHSPIGYREDAGRTCVLFDRAGATIGTADMVGEDTVDLSRCAEGEKAIVRHAVKTSLDDLMGSNDLVICEGLGSVVDARVDIGNLYVADELRRRSSERFIVLSSYCAPGGSVASIVGTYALMEESRRERVVGYLLNGYEDLAMARFWATLATRATGLVHLGGLPFDARLTIPRGASADRFGEAVDLLGAMVEGCTDLLGVAADLHPWPRC